jgi:hypothetical protein
MPNQSEHIAAAIPAGIAFSICKAPQGDGKAILLECIGGALGAIFGAVLPDMIDVPNSPNHRSVAHGVVPAGWLTCVAWKHLDDIQFGLRRQAYQCGIASSGGGPPLRAALYSFAEVILQILAGAAAGLIAGYVSHIILDSQTPCSLPLFC